MAVKGETAAALDRIGGALWGLFIGDALAMPSHWYYGGSGQVVRDYGGPIKHYVQPKKELRGSIMNKSSTGGGGRGSASGDIIGKIINHGKKDYWTPTGSYHYHCTLSKGENTLEAQLVRVVCQSIVQNSGTFIAEDLRQRYIEFMTKPGSHNDCYASTCHRMFFANLTAGKPPAQCPDNDNHNVDTIDGLVMAVPVALAAWRKPLAEAQRDCGTCCDVTRNSSELQGYAAHLAAVLQALLEGRSLNEVLESNTGRGFEAQFASVAKMAARSQDPVVA